MYSEAESELRPPTAERIRHAGEGVIDDASIDRFLAEHHWDHRRRSTKVGPAHVFTRPASLLESVRVDPREYRNHRHMLSVGESDGEPTLTYLVLGDVHLDDLRALPGIESAMLGRGRIRREHFPKHILRVIDLPWLSFEEIAEDRGLSRKAASAYSDRARARLGVDTRAKLTVVGMREGFLNPPLEQWRGRWASLPPYLEKVLPHVHLAGPEIAERVGTTTEAVHTRIVELYRATGARNRSELLLAALANGALTLSDLKVEIRKPEPTEPEKSVLALMDLPVREITKRLGVSRKTVDDYIASVRSKFFLRSRMEVALFSFQEGYFPHERDDSLADVFTEEQMEIAPYLGYSNDEISAKTDLSIAVVNHRGARMRDRAGVRDRVGLALYVARAGLLRPEDYLTPHAGSA